jgi:hypothetical protein
MAYRIIASIAAASAGIYLLNRAWWIMVRLKARNVGIFRDDRRENDWR